MQTDCYTMRGK